MSDRATARLVGNFYRFRAVGVDDVAALRKAQLAFLRPSLMQRIRSGFSADRSHLFYWAAFSVYGSR
ncbi:MAG: CHAT domain-containing protein [Lysobacterales bacterium]